MLKGMISTARRFVFPLAFVMALVFDMAHDPQGTTGASDLDIRFADAGERPVAEITSLGKWFVESTEAEKRRKKYFPRLSSNTQRTGNNETIRSSSEIEKSIKDRLKWNARVEENLVRVQVDRQIVTLSGWVETIEQKRRVAEIAWVPGVRYVDASALQILK